MAKNIVVTGAGSGIGRAIAGHLAERNHAIVLLGRNSESLEATRGRLRQPENHQCFPRDTGSFD